MSLCAAPLDKLLDVLFATTSMKRVRHGLGGSHTVVTYPPLDALRPVEGDPTPIMPTDLAVHGYFHIAFCEFICPFCHYAKTYHGGGRPNRSLDAYVRALVEETQLRAPVLASKPLQSVYIGGGTPTALSLSQLDLLMGAINRWGKPRQLCVETSPMTLAAADGVEKLEYLLQAGVDRLSIGIQSFDEYQLRTLRGHTTQTAVDAVERLMSLGIEINIDLIQDLPFQTRANIDKDLEWIDRFRPDQVTWYLLRFHDESSMFRTYRRGELDAIADDKESALRRDIIIRRMQLLGYTALPGCRFRRVREDDVFKQVRSGVDSQLLGFGASAYSHGWGWFFRNAVSHQVRSGIRDYVSRINAGHSAVTTAALLDEPERNAGRLCQAVRTCITPDLLSIDDALGGSARHVVQRLQAAGLMDEAEEGWRLSRTGLLFEEEIASLFYSRQTRALLKPRQAYWADEDWFMPPRRENARVA